MSTRQAAYFDVDETLIDCKSMFSFLHYYATTSRDCDIDVDRVMSLLRARAAAGADREEINTLYYSAFEGQLVRALDQAGSAWFDWVSEQGGFFHAPTLHALREDAEQGYRIVLVSGSLEPVLRPIARHLRASDILCASQDVTQSGVLTGGISKAIIGEGKAQAIVRHARELRISLTDSKAYADDVSDLPMLRAVGHPVVVGTSPALLAFAAERNAPVLTVDVHEGLGLRDVRSRLGDVLTSTVA